MWYLISLSNPDVKYTLLVGKEYVVGRKDCDIVIPGDGAVSRKHAILTVSHTELNLSTPSKLPVLSLKDVSKFGCYVNKVKVTETNQQLLNDGNEVVFGTKSIFTVVYEPFIISMSCLDNAAKKKVRTLVCTLGGHIVNDWQKECSFLVMNTINVTIKVISAMVALKHIVTPEYIQQYVNYLQGDGSEPDPVKFLPKVSESQIDPSEVSFTRNPKRSSVFQGMTFIFLNPKQFKKMSLAIELGGGTPMLLEEDSKGDDKILVQKGTVVMNCVVDSNSQSQAGQEWVQHVQKYLKRHKKHMIQDAELGYAVLYCSTDKHCNPDHDFLSQMLQKQASSQSLSQAEVLAANTEATQDSTSVKSRRRTGDPESIDETIKGSKDSTKVKSPVIPFGNVKHEPSSKDQTMTSQTTAPTSEKQTRLRKRTPSPVPTTSRQTRSRSRSPSPVPDVKPTRQRKRSPSPMRSRSPSPVSNVQPTRQRKRSPSPRRSKSPSPVSYVQPTNRRKKSPSPKPRDSNHKGERHSSDETESNLSIGRTIKQEILTPSTPAYHRKTQNYNSGSDIKPDFSKSPNRASVSDKGRESAKMGNIHKVDPDIFDAVQIASQQKNKKVVASQSRKVKVEILDDSDEEVSAKRKRHIVEDSDDEVEVPKRTRRQEIKEDVDDDLFAPKQQRKDKQNKNDCSSKSKLKKRTEIFEDSDDDSGPRNQRKKRKFSGSEDETDIFGSHSNRRNRKLDSDNDDSRNVQRIKADSDDDLFGNKNDKSPTNRHKEEKKSTVVVRVKQENEGDSNTRRCHTSEESDEINERRRRQINHETALGFLTTAKPIEDQVCRSTDYIKEENLPSSCIVTEFAALVSRKKKKVLPEADGNVPAGYTKWNGKLVKNFKKFKKTGYTGANSLPRIIGGRDLEVHIGSQRKEIDDWFREALEAESQQSEADRKASELFEWEPARAAGKKRTR